MKTTDYEKLGISYLGKLADKDGNILDVPYLYKNKDLTTHGAIIGMTGSGKSGLGIGMIEEAAMDKVPCILIDPKGDLGNLLLLFEDLKPDDFEPWIDSRDAEKKGLSITDYAKSTAKTWQTGLESFGQSKERIKALKQNAAFHLYTPGSSAGEAVSVLSSFEAPSTTDDRELLSNLAAATVTSLLAIINLKGDYDKAVMLLTNILYKNWQDGKGLGLEDLMAQIIKPPFENLGLFPIESIFPSGKRMELAMEINMVLANPTFAAWLQGEPLEIGKLLYEEDGRARVNIFNIAHLNDNERMFFTTLLLNKLIGWMRRQQGSSNLKLLFYMDEVFGFFPPNSNPPSKKPMLLLLKQARAYGVGIVLATQNPVDLDYKGLSNIGTWFIGKLQTEQDQEKVADGIAAASQGAYSKNELKSLLGKLKSRMFLAKNIHEEGVKLFTTRWVMSYLKGPMSSEDIRRIVAPAKAAPQEKTTAMSTPQGISTSHAKPIIPLKIEELFLNPMRDSGSYKPTIVATAELYYSDSKRGIERQENLWCRMDVGSGTLAWSEPITGTLDLLLLSDTQEETMEFETPDAAIGEKGFVKNITATLKEHLYQESALELFKAAALKLESEIGESREDFKIKATAALLQNADKQIESVKEQYAKKIKTLEERLTRAQFALDKERQDASSAKTDALISAGLTVLGALFGREGISTTTINRGASTARKAGRIGKEQNDITLAEEKIETLQEEIDTLASKMAEEIDSVKSAHAIESLEIETFRVKPKKSGITNISMRFVWDGTGVV